MKGLIYIATLLSFLQETATYIYQVHYKSIKCIIKRSRISNLQKLEFPERLHNPIQPFLQYVKGYFRNMF